MKRASIRWLMNTSKHILKIKIELITMSPNLTKISPNFRSNLHRNEESKSALLSFPISQKTLNKWVLFEEYSTTNFELISSWKYIDKVEYA